MIAISHQSFKVINIIKPGSPSCEAAWVEGVGKHRTTAITCTLATNRLRTLRFAWIRLNSSVICAIPFQSWQSKTPGFYYCHDTFFVNYFFSTTLSFEDHFTRWQSDKVALHWEHPKLKVDSQLLVQENLTPASYHHLPCFPRRNEITSLHTM